MDDLELSRRKFLEFLGKGIISLPALAHFPGLAPSALAAGSRKLPFVEPSDIDALLLPEGFEYQVLVSWGDALGDSLHFGMNNDYVAYLPEGASEGMLWVNHESPEPLDLASGYSGKGVHTQGHVIEEQKSVGGSLIHIRQEKGRWVWKAGDLRNRRLDARTKIPFAWNSSIAGKMEAVGTLANCAGGTTPWGTVLTCEENFQDFYGDRSSNGKFNKSKFGWEKYFNYPPEHYGWVVEVNPRTGAAKKLVALGRFGHEGATVVLGKDNRCVVYMGDDKEDQCIYKFIADRSGSLERGKLYVADTKKGTWLSLQRDEQETLKKNFKNQTDVLIYAREAAAMVGATPQDRPEGIAVGKAGKGVFVALTNNKRTKNYYGSLLKIEESGDDPMALTFEASVFKTGGGATGFACPDNIIFDPKGNLWFTSDMPAGDQNYNQFKNNGLFYIPLTGPQAGEVVQVASSPRGAEMTGPFFNADGSQLFLSIQHPGEGSTKDHLVSHWPVGGNSIPKSSVVVISGPGLKRLMA